MIEFRQNAVATPLRPASVHAAPILGLLGAPLPRESGGDQAKVVMEPTRLLPDRNSSPVEPPRIRVRFRPGTLQPGSKVPLETGGDQAKGRMEPRNPVPDRNSPAPAGGDGQHHRAILVTTAVTEPTAERQGDHAGQDAGGIQETPADVVAEITQLCRMRRRWQKAEIALTLQAKALCRAWTGGDKGEAGKLFEGAAKGNPSDPSLALALAPFLSGIERFEAERLALEKSLRKLARSLPVWKAWVEGVRGFGDLRLAIIVGECGDLSNYSNPAKVWKRMGLAVIGEGRQRRVSDKEQALLHGYNPERRAVAYVIGTELIKAQVRQVKDSDGKDTGGRTTLGHYGALYLERKRYESGREGVTKSHANNRAARYMVKRALRDLWIAWHK